MTAVEIAVQDPAGIAVALRDGATRIELCSALETGGLTPSAGLIEVAVEAAASADRQGFVHVLVRPRGGGFVYDDREIDLIERDVAAAVAAGADGVVVGALDHTGAVHLTALDRFVAAAGGATVTMHRAIDVGGDPVAALEAVVGRGVTRVLTSGGARDCRTGIGVLERMVQAADGRVEVMAGGGVRTADISPLLAIGVDAVHLSARGRSGRGGPSGPGGGDADFDITDPGLVRAAVAVVLADSLDR